MQQEQQFATLSARQQAFIDALLVCSTVTQAAEQAHINRATAHRWLKMPEVKEYYRSELKALHQANMDKLVKAEVLAINCLLRNLQARSELVQVTSATKILEFVAEAYKVREIEGMLDEIQERLAANGTKLRRVN